MIPKSERNFTIVIPAYREVSNITELVTTISQVDFGDRHFEVLLIDDNSQDGTVEIVQQLSSKYEWLKLIVRSGSRDLSLSIIQGFQAARYHILVTMDADLSHPSKDIPKLLALLEQPDVDMVIGSRYIPGGSVDSQWPLLRRITSQTAASMARCLLPSDIRDPLSGFIAMRKTTFLACTTLKPIGWKIGLELMIKCRCKNIREIPIHFSQRRKGSSKLNLKISLDYVRHVLTLMYFKYITEKQLHS